MKFQLFTRITGMLIVTVVATSILTKANAQQLAINKPYKNSSALLKENKITDELLAITGERSLNKANLHAQKDFNLKYKNVSNASWYEVDGGAIARFMSGNVSTSVIYGKSGGWLQTISCYGEKCMPKDVRAIVKGTYYDYDIVNIQEVQLPDKDSSIFLVDIQDANSIKVLRVCEGEMEVIHEYTRG
jgi:hypothetical protein